MTNDDLQPMKLGVLAKTPLPEKIEKDYLNTLSWEEMAKYCDLISIIAVGKDRKTIVRRGKLCYWLSSGGGANPYWLSVSYFVHALRVGLALARKGEVDVWVTSDVAVAGLAGVFLKFSTSRPLIVHLQGEIFNLPHDRFSRLRARLSARLASYVCSRADRVRAVSEKIGGQAQQAGIAVEKIVVLPSRCDLNLFDLEKWRKQGKALQDELGLTGSQVLVFVGSLNASKGVTFILDAMAEIIDRYPDVRLVVVGDGPLEKELKEKSARLSLGEHVIFYGRVSYLDVPKFLAAANIFLSPSLDEGMPRSVLEAMAMELPVVVTNVGGNPEIVEHGRTGFLVEPRDFHAIAKSVVELLSDSAISRRMGMAGRRVVHERYSFQAQIFNLAQVHYEVLRKDND